MFAVADLDQGIELMRSITGITPEFGGSHPGHGTRNALMSLGDDQYLEVIAPDPDQVLTGTLGEELASASPFVRTWAVATSNYEQLVSCLEPSGFGHHVVDMSRTRPDGVHLAWRILFVTNHPFGLAMPFFIDWLDSPHPAESTPKGCTLRAFNLQCPGGDDLRAFFSAIQLDVAVATGPLRMSADVQAPRGEVMIA